MQKKILLITLCASIMFSFIIGYAIFNHYSSTTQNYFQDNNPTIVTTEQAYILADATTAETIGQLEAINNTLISFNQQGRILKILKPEGSNIKQGEALIKMDPVLILNEIALKKKSLQIAKSQLKRIKILAKTNMVSQTELEIAKNNSIIEENAIQQLNKQIEEYTITAPIDGILANWQVQVGEEVLAAQVLNNLVDKNKFLVSYSLPENLYSQLKLGQKVQIFDHSKQLIAIAKLSFIAPLSNKITHTVLVKANIEITYQPILSGESVHIEHSFSEAIPRIWVSEESVASDMNGYYVYKIIDNVAKRQVVQLGKRAQGIVEILQGLQNEETIVKDGITKLYENAKVIIDNHYSKTPAKHKDS